MGHLAILVIGNDYEDQLDKFEQAGLFDFVKREIPAFPLKKDREDAIAAAKEKARFENEWRRKFSLLNAYEKEWEPTDIDGFTYTSSATKSDIDFEAMRSAIRAAAEERWKFINSVCRAQSWTPFSFILEKYSNLNYSVASRKAYDEWKEQPAVKEILQTFDLNPSRFENRSRLEIFASRGLWNDMTHQAIDLFLLPQDAYVKSFGFRKMLGYTDIIINSMHLSDFNETELFNTIPEEALITFVSVHA